MTRLLLAVFWINVARIWATPQAQIAPIHEKRRVDVEPELQNIPRKKELQHLRPPPPRLPQTNVTIFIGLSVFKDGERCGKTILTGFLRAQNPQLLRFGVVDQVGENELTCLQAYCKLARVEWPEAGECRYEEQITIDVRRDEDSRGPTLARHFQQQLIKDEVFCLQLDGHSIFTNGWDKNLIKDWLQADNEMAVLSTYLHNIHSFVRQNGDNDPPRQLPILCKTIRGHTGCVRNEGASMLHNPRLPQMVALWGAGLSFSKCHAETRVRIDNHTLWMFDGEEFLRSSHLWTYGYDIYAPSVTGAVVYHNYSRVPHRFEHVKVDPEKKRIEKLKGINRFKKMVGLNFSGPIDYDEMDVYGFGTVRTFDQYLNFSGVSFDPNKNDTDTCHQLYWVPYSDPTQVEELLPGWDMYHGIKSPQTPQSEPLESEHQASTRFKSMNMHITILNAHRPSLAVNKAPLLLWNTISAIICLVSLIILVLMYSNRTLWVSMQRTLRAKGRTRRKV